MSRSRNDPGQSSAPPRYPGSFLLALREALQEMKWRPLRWLGLAVECADAEGREHVLGLENLYRRLRREDRSNWPNLIGEMLRSVPPDSAETVSLRDVADRILFRIGPPFAGAEPDRDIWYAPLIGDRLGVTLVVDHPNSMSYVTDKQVADSGENGDFWLRRAVANLQAKTPADCVHPIHEETGLLHCELGDAYDSSRALLLDHMLPGHDATGFFVAVPGRDQLLILPVTKDALAHVAWLRAVAAKTYQTVPYPISDEIFWIRRDEWRRFQIVIEKNQVIVVPPPEFAEVLQQLAPDFVTEIEEQDSEDTKWDDGEGE